MTAEVSAEVRDELDPDAVQVRRDAPLSMLIGGGAAAVAIAFGVRASSGGNTGDWWLAALMAVIAVVHVATVFDSRAPLMVIDRRGIRARVGRRWDGVAWADVAQVEHRVRERLMRDGRLSVLTTDNRRLGVRLALSTRLFGCDWHELSDAVADLSGGVEMVERAANGGPLPVRMPGERMSSEADAADGADRAQPEVSAARPVAAARRSDVALARRAEGEDTVQLRTDDLELTEVIDPRRLPGRVVGADLAAARERLRLSVDQLAERTRIRPHVIEAIEVDDFAPCGGDFYARGHLRTLARVLGVDADALLARYDKNFADAPIEARRVFEAELATGPSGSIHGTQGRLNWSVLVAAVMAAVLVWSIARLVMDGPVPLADQPVLNGSPSGRATLSAGESKVPVEFTAATGGAQVIVRDARGRVVFDEQLAFMQTAQVDVAPPVRISSTDGGLTVIVDGVEQGALGATGEDAQRVFAP